MLKKTSFLILSTLLIGLMILTSCQKEDTPTIKGKDINTATKTSIDRFSPTAGNLMVRDATNGLPEANSPINFDEQPFITTGLDRTGEPVMYYNFDVQSTTPENIYILFKNGATTSVEGQYSIIPTIPGETFYNDFWLMNMVIVPDDYVPNSLTSSEEIIASGYTIIKTTTILNCPVVPYGSTASRSYTAGVASTLFSGWYKGQAVAYFNFGEKELITNVDGKVPTSPIYVMFNDNTEGPSSGFMTESANPTQTHNVLSTIPSDSDYSPLWDVQVIDNINFGAVTDLTTATSFASTPADAKVNCPIVK